MQQQGERFIKVYEFMMRDLGLQGVQLLLYARICGFSLPGGDGCFYESRANTAERLGVTDRAVTKGLKALVERGLIVECGRHRLASGRYTRCYATNWDMLADMGVTDEFSSPEEGSMGERSSPGKACSPERCSRLQGNNVHPILKKDSKEPGKERRRYAEYDE